MNKGELYDFLMNVLVKHQMYCMDSWADRASLAEILTEEIHDNLRRNAKPGR